MKLYFPIDWIKSDKVKIRVWHFCIGVYFLMKLRSGDSAQDFSFKDFGTDVSLWILRGLQEHLLFRKSANGFVKSGMMKFFYILKRWGSNLGHTLKNSKFGRAWNSEDKHLPHSERRWWMLDFRIPTVRLQGRNELSGIS